MDCLQIIKIRFSDVKIYFVLLAKVLLARQIFPCMSTEAESERVSVSTRISLGFSWDLRMTTSIGLRETFFIHEKLFRNEINLKDKQSERGEFVKNLTFIKKSSVLFPTPLAHSI